MTFEQTELNRILRRRAEENLKSGAAATEQVQSLDEANLLLHELRVHQIELEMQNEELLRTQVELDTARERYFDLYELAPVGYCTLSEQGLILEANLTVANLLGAARGDIVNKPLSRYIFREDQDVYYLHRKQLLESGEPQAYDLRMVKMDGSVFWAHLAADGAPVCRVVVSDITERKRAAAALKQLNEELEQQTKELERRNHELEQMNKAFVGRELKMVELKEKIRKLEERPA
jgi:PAS domain S-box-containing protein